MTERTCLGEEKRGYNICRLNLAGTNAYGVVYYEVVFLFVVWLIVSIRICQSDYGIADYSACVDRIVDDKSKFTARLRIPNNTH